MVDKNLMTLLMLGTCILLGVFGQIAMKKGVNELNEKKALENFFDLKTMQAMASNFFVLAGFAAYAIAAVLWLVAMKWLDISFMYPLISLGYVLVTLAAIVFLGEQVSLMRWGGTILIIIGSVLIVLTRS